MAEITNEMRALGAHLVERATAMYAEWKQDPAAFREAHPDLAFPQERIGARSREINGDPSNVVTSKPVDAMDVIARHVFAGSGLGHRVFPIAGGAGVKAVYP